MADGENDVNDEDQSSDMVKRVEGRKKRVINGYRASAITNFVVGMFTLVMAGLSKTSGVGIATASYYASGPAMASTVSLILAGAAENDRLGSDTYKRLNVLLSKYGALWLLAGLVTFAAAKMGPAKPPAAAAKVFTNPLVVLASLTACVNGIKGFAYGVKGWDKQANKGYGNELADMVQSLRSLFFVKNLAGTGYLGATVMIGALKIRKLLEIVQLVLTGGGFTTAAVLSTRVTRYAKLTLLTGIVFTLKDAADRNRLSGTTFIQLNFLSSAVFASLAGKHCLLCNRIIWSSHSLFHYTCVCARALHLLIECQTHSLFHLPASLLHGTGKLTKFTGATCFFSAFSLLNALIAIAVKKKS